ncbi:hypothetical protein HQ865_22780 [Mucilaginibacter mali]|uniref:Uncharacterized protein n=1 Tax=Mucilaginibacter mali TaxID=2740462 RepID=A0A7D4PWH6_9SPHI|nr:hypothetical protein [Mucilaginibacter mali]QKJ32468.1 hypothetical protein HQ865_22780 [Mucilaginibacter mali]
MQKKPQARTRGRRPRYLTPEQAKAILDFLERPELPEHDSPFKLYFNGRLIASAGTTNPKPDRNEND